VDKDLIVIILAPTLNENGESRDWNYGSIGTGYPVGDDLILTSRHVVMPEGRNNHHPLYIRWHYLVEAESEKNGWQKLSEDAIVWSGEGDMDIALIRAVRPEKSKNRLGGTLSFSKPLQGENWYGSGFPKATRIDVVREPGEFSGTVESMADNANFFEVNVTSSPEENHLWKGASGMPVFLDDGKIYGVVRSVPDNFSAQKLKVVPLWKLKQNEGFRQCLNGGQEEGYLDELKEWFKPIFVKCIERSVSIEKKSLKISNDFLNPSSDILDVKQLADALIYAEPNKRVAFVEELFGEFEESGNSEENLVLHQISVLMLSLIFPSDGRMVKAIRESREGIIESETAGNIDTEIAMALADKKSPDIQYQGGSASFPYNVSSKASRCGLDERHEKAIDDVSAYLVNKHVPGDCKAIVRNLWGESYKKGAVGDVVARYENAEDQLRALARRSGKGQRRFYAFLPSELDADGQKRWVVLKTYFKDLDLVKRSRFSDPEIGDLISDLEEIILQTCGEQSNGN